MAENDSKGKWINVFGLAILLVCYAGALWNVVQLKTEEQQHDVIRMAHWQLELGVRDGLNAVIERFEEYKAAQGESVKIVQIPITEKSYTQYVTTQLIGGTAPDMIEIGFFPDEYLGRYFYPLTSEVQQPNPLLKKPTEAPWNDIHQSLAEKRWMDTFTDGLRSQYKESLFDYYGVGFSQFTVRMFYNKDLFREVIGSDDPPTSFNELLEICGMIQDYATQNNVDLTPISSSKYQVPFMRNRYLGALTADLFLENDLDRDGWCSGEEKIMSVLSGRFGLENPQYKAGLDAMNDLAAYFPRGFMALERNDAQASFVQGRTALISSGSWSAKGFVAKIDALPENQRFDVGVFDLPIMTPDNPRYGNFVDGNVSEANTGTGFSFGITRFSKHVDLCLEFLRFCTLPEINTLLNDHAQWIPAIRGAASSDLMKKFEPNYVGYWGRMDTHFSGDGDGRLIEEQEYWPYISGDINYETYVANINEQLPVAAASDYAKMKRSVEENLPDRRAKRSAYLALSVFAPSPEEKAIQKRKLLRSWDSLVDMENTPRRFDRLLEMTLSTSTNAFVESFKRQLQREEF